jgi:hypothetical protein
MTDQVFVLLGIDPEFIPPGWMGTQGAMESGLREGWKADIIRLAVRKLVAKRAARKQPLPQSFRYLLPAIAEEHRLAAAPPPATAHPMKDRNHAGKTNAADFAFGLRDQWREEDERKQREFTLLRTFDGG